MNVRCDLLGWPLITAATNRSGSASGILSNNLASGRRRRDPPFARPFSTISPACSPCYADGHASVLRLLATRAMPQIRSAGLLMRTLEDADVPALVDAVHESLESVGRWMPWCTPAYAEVEARTWIELCRANLAMGCAYDFGVFDSSLFLGAAGLNSINKEHRFCNLGYWVRQSRQRQRVASRSINMLTRYAFETLGLHRVEIVVAIGNAASEAVALKSGAMAECIARNRLFIHGRPVPATVFSIVPQRFNEEVNTGSPGFILHGR